MLAAPAPPAVRRTPPAVEPELQLALRFPARADRAARQPVDVAAEAPAAVQPVAPPVSTPAPLPRSRDEWAHAPRPPRPPRAPRAVAPALVLASGAAAVVVAFAMAQVGDRYAAGATGPDAWDCSGLSQAAAARVGVRLPHNADGQRGYGRPVTRAEIQPGDFVFWTSPTAHVAVYIGNGEIVAAATQRSGVRRQRLWGTPVEYRRMVG